MSSYELLSCLLMRLLCWYISAIFKNCILIKYTFVTENLALVVFKCFVVSKGRFSLTLFFWESCASINKKLWRPYPEWWCVLFFFNTLFLLKYLPLAGSFPLLIFASSLLWISEWLHLLEFCVEWLCVVTVFLSSQSPVQLLFMLVQDIESGTSESQGMRISA